MPVKNPAAYMRQRRAAAREEADIREYECETCHKTFTPQRSDARYCSDACRAAARRQRVTITEWINNPAGWWTPGPPPRPAICAAEVNQHGHVFCQDLAVWCRQSFHHPTSHLVMSEFLCDKHRQDAEDNLRREAIQKYREHEEQTDPVWLEGKGSRWSKGATAEALTWWLQKRCGVVKVLPELIAPHAVLLAKRQSVF